MSYLEQLRQTQPVARDGSSMNPPSPMFRQYGQSLLPRLRLTQLIHLARAYDIQVNRDGTKKSVLPILVAAEEQGVFNQPPKNPYYFERARWSADQIKDARSKGMAIGPLVKWTGPDPDPKPEPKEYHERVSERNRERNKNNVISGLRARAKELGINSFAKGREALAKEIAVAEGKMNAPVDS